MARGDPQLHERVELVVVVERAEVTEIEIEIQVEIQIQIQVQVDVELG